jgi:hypothetical protein
MRDDSFIFQTHPSQLNIIDEIKAEYEDIEVEEIDIDDNVSNFGDAGMGEENNKCIGGRWELKRRK